MLLFFNLFVYLFQLDPDPDRFPVFSSPDEWRHVVDTAQEALLKANETGENMATLH